jgi:hypothetical protein
MIPEVLWTLRCPAQTADRIGENFYKFFTLPPSFGPSPKTIWWKMISDSRSNARGARLNFNE